MTLFLIRLTLCTFVLAQAQKNRRRPPPDLISSCAPCRSGGFCCRPVLPPAEETKRRPLLPTPSTSHAETTTVLLSTPTFNDHASNITSDRHHHIPSEPRPSGEEPASAEQEPALPEKSAAAAPEQQAAEPLPAPATADQTREASSYQAQQCIQHPPAAATNAKLLDVIGKVADIFSSSKGDCTDQGLDADTKHGDDDDSPGEVAAFVALVYGGNLIFFAAVAFVFRVVESGCAKLKFTGSSCIEEPQRHIEMPCWYF